MEAADEVGYFCIIEGAGGLLVEGSESVGDVLGAFVLEPAGYAVEGAVAVAGCVVVLHVGLNGFVELSGGFLCVGGLAVLFFLLAFFCCDIIGFPVEELVAVELDDLGLGVAPVDSCDVAALDVGTVMVNDGFHHGSVVVCAKGYGCFGGEDEFGSGERVLCVTVAVAKWDGGALSNVKLNAGYAREIPDTL